MLHGESQQELTEHRVQHISALYITHYIHFSTYLLIYWRTNLNLLNYVLTNIWMHQITSIITNMYTEILIYYFINQLNY